MTLFEESYGIVQGNFSLGERKQTLFWVDGTAEDDAGW